MPHRDHLPSRSGRRADSASRSARGLKFRPLTRAAFLLAAAAALACSPPPPRLGVIPDFALTAVSSDGRPSGLTRQGLMGRVWIVDFIFTRCSGPCPLLSSTMAALQKELPESVGLLSMTVDPDRDDVPTLAEYARRYAAVPGRWLFVAGSKPAIYELLISGFKVPVALDPKAPSGRRVTHTTRLVLLDRDANIRGYFDADDKTALARLKKAAVGLGVRQ